MINVEKFYSELEKNKIDFYTGVPDSLLKDICAYISDNVSEDKHIIAVNEGTSVGLAVGYHLATEKIPLVYMQNSGLGNTVNPLLSIADEKVYSIPMVLLIGWRGEPNVKDDPQHIKQGEVTEVLLQSMGIEYEILDKNSDYKKVIQKVITQTKTQSKPFAILIKKGSFGKYSLQSEVKTNYTLDREGAVKLIIDSLEDDDIVVSTTGKTSREVFEYREELGQTHEKDFLTVGAMGHTSAIALGVSIGNKNRNVYCFDGDGSVLMHMGSLAINGSMKGLNNFKHIIINNGAHDSVGGQPTLGFQINFCKVAEACNYSFVNSAETQEEVKTKLMELKNHKGKGFLEIKVNKGARENLGRPTTTPKENKIAFQKFVKC